MTLPISYRVSRKLLNALKKYIENIDKDIDDVEDQLQLKKLRSEIHDVSSRWSERAVLTSCNLKSAWETGKAAIYEKIAEAIEVLAALPPWALEKLSDEELKARQLVLDKYSSESKTVPFNDKQTIKALNTIRAQKDCVLL